MPWLFYRICVKYTKFAKIKHKFIFNNVLLSYHQLGNNFQNI
jgi:hypothetical protein